MTSFRVRYADYRLPKFWRVLPLNVHNGLLIAELTMLGPTHGFVRTNYADMSVTLWPKPAHVVVRRLLVPVMWRTGIGLHRFFRDAGICQHYGEHCRHPLMWPFFKVIDLLDGVRVRATMQYVETTTSGTAAKTFKSPLTRTDST